MKLKALSETAKLHFNSKTKGFHFPGNETESFQGGRQKFQEEILRAWHELKYKPHPPITEKPSNTCALTTSWETHGQLALSHAFPHHLMLRCSTAWNRMHSSQFLRRTGPLGSQSLQTWRPRPAIWWVSIPLSPPSHSGSGHGGSDGKGAMPLTGARVRPQLTHHETAVWAAASGERARGGSQDRQWGRAPPQRPDQPFKSGAGLQTSKLVSLQQPPQCSYWSERLVTQGSGGMGAGGWYVEICAGSLGPTFREGGTWRGVYGRQTLPQDEHLPRKMRDALGPQDQLSPLVVHRCAAPSLSCSYHGRSLVRKLATDNISKLNLKWPLDVLLPYDTLGNADSFFKSMLSIQEQLLNICSKNHKLIIN